MGAPGGLQLPHNSIVDRSVVTDTVRTSYGVNDAIENDAIESFVERFQDTDQLLNLHTQDSEHLAFSVGQPKARQNQRYVPEMMTDSASLPGDEGISDDKAQHGVEDEETDEFESQIRELMQQFWHDKHRAMLEKRGTVS